MTGLPPRLSMRGIVKRFGATTALAGVDLCVGGGEIHAVLGQNGAGKSTLMKILSGALTADAGSIELDGAPFTPRDPKEGRRAGIAMIYQELSLAPDLSVADNVFLGVEPTRHGWLGRRTMRSRTAGAMATLGHPGIDPDIPVRRLPIAARQLVEIARSLVSGASVLVLDEPTSSLGRPDAERLFETMRRLASDGLAIVYITHFLEEALAIADRYSVLRDGRVVAEGPTAGVLPSAIVTSMVGQPEALAYPRTQRRPGEAVLELDDLAGAAKPTRACLTLHRGEVLGIFGLVGSGRTELVRAIFGLDPVVSGRVSVLGVSGPAAPPERWQAGVGMVSEDRQGEGLAVAMSVVDNLTITRLGRSPLSWVSPARQREAVAPWIERLGIKVADPFRPVAALSGGNQQKVALGRLLLHDVDVLLLDEPTRGIDVGSKSEIYRMIDELVTLQARPKAVLLIGSYLPELLGISDRIAVMCRGGLGPAVLVSETDEHSLLLAASGTGSG